MLSFSAQTEIIRLNRRNLQSEGYSPKISVLTQNTLKFACFSDTITSANMWGHYASSSTGFSIGYNFRGFPCVDSVGEGNSELPTRCELFPIIYQSRRYDATPYAEWLLICSLVNDYFKTFSSQGNILDAAKILPCPDMLAPIKIMIHKCEIRLRSFSVNGRPFFRGVSYIAVHLYAKTAAASLWAAQRQFSSYIFF